jgi:8-oxo-dGTP pyrophosphatase MutT (NUDIX family)
MTTAAASPRDASTVILLNPLEEGGQGAFEVFMVKRHAKSQFMANAYVYPGGRLDPVDCSPEMASVTSGLDGRACAARLREDLDAARARGLFVAALREAFEEAGVLLTQPEPADRLDEWRRALNDASRTLVALGQQEGVCFALDRLYPFAHWITPEVEPRRYDTRFFVAICPPQQQAWLRHDEHETVDSLWIEPTAALERYGQGGFQLAPPTFRTLEELAALGSIDAVLARCERGPIPTIQPVFVTGEDGGLMLLLPGDPDHPATPSPQPPQVEGPTRIMLEEGRWRSC